MALKRLVAGAALRRAASSPRERIAMRPRRASGLGMDKVSAFLVELSRRERATASNLANRWPSRGARRQQAGWGRAVAMAVKKPAMRDARSIAVEKTAASASARR